MGGVKIAVDYQSAAGKKTGIGVAAENLVTELRLQAKDVDWILYQSGQKELNTPGRIWWESVEIPRRTRRDKPDMLYSPGFAPPMKGNVPSVVTVHDLIGMALPSNQKPASRFYWSTWLPAAIRRARRVVASSESTRGDIERFLGIPQKQVRVVPLGVDASFRKLEQSSQAAAILERLEVRQPYFISVSTLEPRKNHIRLLEAYKKLKAIGRAPFSLVIVGKPGCAEEALHTFVKVNGLEQDVRFLGYARQEELVALYNASLGYVMISLYEGFGLPVLEAMSCGKSGVCGERTSLPEVAGDTGILVDPDDAESIAAALDKLASDAGYRQKMEAAAHARSKKFSNAECARQMIEVFRNEVQK
jgi:glycosyltransferase involved in cell wall biosynthesis